MSYLYGAMIIVGIAAVAWGLPAAHRLRKPFDILAALVVLAGIIVALGGILLSILPEFFYE